MGFPAEGPQVVVPSMVEPPAVAAGGQAPGGGPDGQGPGAVRQEPAPPPHRGGLRGGIGSSFASTSIVVAMGGRGSRVSIAEGSPLLCFGPRKEALVLDAVRRYVEAGREALTPKRAEELARVLVREGQARRDQVGKVAGDLLEWSRKSSERLRETVRREVGRQIDRSGLATKDELEGLKRRIRTLEADRKTPARTTSRRKTTARKAATGRRSASSRKGTSRKRTSSRKA
jgi:polyhydroxyalkanoate synthesis regulator phasin